MYDTNTMIAIATNLIGLRIDRNGGVVTQEMVDNVLEISMAMLEGQDFKVEADLEAVRREVYRRNNIAA
jgi:hypothetical protein